MRRLLLILSVCCCLGALALNDGAATLALNYPDATVTAYARGAEYTGSPQVLTHAHYAATFELDAGRTPAVLDLLNAVIVDEYTAGGVHVIEAYSPYLSDSVETAAGRVNLQIADKTDKTLVGMPVLVGGY